MIFLIFPLRISSAFLILVKGNDILPVIQSRPGLTSDSCLCHTHHISCPQKTCLFHFLCTGLYCNYLGLRHSHLLSVLLSIQLILNNHQSDIYLIKSLSCLNHLTISSTHLGWKSQFLKWLIMSWIIRLLPSITPTFALAPLSTTLSPCFLLQPTWPYSWTFQANLCLGIFALTCLSALKTFV